MLRALDSTVASGCATPPMRCSTGCASITRGFPRVLEAVKAILDGDDTLDPADLLARTRHLPEDQVVQVLVGKANELLDARRAGDAGPVGLSGAGLGSRGRLPAPAGQPHHRRHAISPGWSAASWHGSKTALLLAPGDRDYARSQLSSGIPGDSSAAFTLAGAGSRWDYYTQIRTPRESLADPGGRSVLSWPIRVACDTGDFDTAARVLQAIDFTTSRCGAITALWSSCASASTGGSPTAP